MEVLLLLTIGILNLLCFLAGAKVGNEASKEKPYKLPTIKSPMTIVKEHREQKRAEEAQSRLDILLHNVEVYDGTARGQEDVPKR